MLIICAVMGCTDCASSDRGWLGRRQIVDYEVRSRQPAEPSDCRRDSSTVVDYRERQSHCRAGGSFPAHHTKT